MERLQSGFPKAYRVCTYRETIHYICVHIYIYIYVCVCVCVYVCVYVYIYICRVQFRVLVFRLDTYMRSRGTFELDSLHLDSRERLVMSAI